MDSIDNSYDDRMKDEKSINNLIGHYLKSHSFQGGVQPQYDIHIINEDVSCNERSSENKYRRVSVWIKMYLGIRGQIRSQ